MLNKGRKLRWLHAAGVAHIPDEESIAQEKGPWTSDTLTLCGKTVRWTWSGYHSAIGQECPECVAVLTRNLLVNHE